MLNGDSCEKRKDKPQPNNMEGKRAAIRLVFEMSEGTSMHMMEPSIHQAGER